jgi:hypothetical protein
MDHRKRSPYVSWVTSSRQTGPGFRGGLKLDLGLHLGDSNQISFRPPSRFGCPCWSPWPPCNSPSMVMTSSATTRGCARASPRSSATIHHCRRGRSPWTTALMWPGQLGPSRTKPSCPTSARGFPGAPSPFIRHRRAPSGRHREPPMSSSVKFPSRTSSQNSRKGRGLTVMS